MLQISSNIILIINHDYLTSYQILKIIRNLTYINYTLFLIKTHKLILRRQV